MNSENAYAHKPFDPSDYPSLREFFPAYLHQDFNGEYGSATAAVKVFLADASGDEIVQVKEEWKTFRNALRGRPFQEVQAALRALGSAWVPETEAQFNEFDEILTRAEA
ncbi:MAG: contact-dependent growth inhibition system immunity protein [Candidatus Acidiferrum sp.]